jgi:hypothetical protein
MGRLWIDSALFILLVGLGAWNIILIPHMLSSHPCCAMFNIFVAMLDLTVAGLFGVDIVSEVKRARNKSQIHKPAS